MNHINSILVIGSEHHNTYSLLRCFGEEGMKVDLLLYDCSDSYIGHSRHINKLWYCKDAHDAVYKLKKIVDDPSKRFVVIPASDTAAALMNDQYEYFNGRCIFFNTGNVTRLSYYMDKEVQTRFASEVGFDVPRTTSYDGNERIYFDSFPCIIKPLASIDGGKRIVVCRCQEDIDKHKSDFDGVGRVLVQEFLEKEEEIVILGVSFGVNVVIPGYIKKIRDIRGGTTYSITAPSSDLGTSLVECATNLVRNLHYEGLFGIECIKCCNRYYFVEINLRNDATSYSLAVAGANLPMMFYKAQVEGGLKCFTGSVRKIFSMVELVDFGNVLHRKVGLLRWLKERKQAACLYFYSKEDKECYRYAKKQYLEHLMKKLFIK